MREAHVAGGQVDNTLVAVDLGAPGPGQVLAEGSDFYASPRLSPDGARLAWLVVEPPQHALGRHRIVGGRDRR